MTWVSVNDKDVVGPTPTIMCTYMYELCVEAVDLRSHTINWRNVGVSLLEEDATHVFSTLSNIRKVGTVLNYLLPFSVLLMYVGLM